jgi:hypothetical protein
MSACSATGLPVTAAMIAGSLLAVVLALGMRRKDEL